MDLKSGNCYVCDMKFIINDDETTNHVTKDDEIDYDQDRDHVAFQLGR